MAVRDDGVSLATVEIRVGLSDPDGAQREDHRNEDDQMSFHSSSLWVGVSRGSTFKQIVSAQVRADGRSRVGWSITPFGFIASAA
jgi:hypothetical protein